MSPRPDPIADLARRAWALPPAERQAFVRAQARDAATAAAVERILTQQEERTLPPTAHPAAAAPPAPSEDPRRRRLGAYTLIRPLGEGGMGVVHLAEQDRPRRPVALKIIRPGLLTPRLLKRFELEAQTLARLQHPGIAQVYEAGSFDDPHGSGQPYFAMEYIEGRPLNEYAAVHGLNVRARVELFIRICDAVQHAHQRGVIHRDLKSSNILVAADGQPKVLDFGVAKLVDADASPATLRTDAGQIIGTVPYMSPEQIAGRPEDIDTRSDVYTLGVVLFELLSGRLPHDVRGRTLIEASRIIAEASAPRLRSLDGEFRGDLDTIVAKAIERDRDRRYQSPADLAADLRRYLNHEPISARPPSTLYQLRKFARRNRGLVAASAAAAGLLVLGAAGVSWQAVEATRGRALAQRESAIARQVNALLADMLQSADPDVSLGREVTVLEVLDRTAGSIDGRVHDPRILGSIRSTLAMTYQSLGRLPAAEAQARAAIAAFEHELGPDHPDTLNANLSLVNILCDMGRFSEAEPIALGALDGLSARLGPESPDAVAARIVLSRLLQESGRVRESADHLDQALTLAEERLGPTHPQTLFALHNKAAALRDEGRFDEAIPLFERAIRLRTAAFGPTHSQTLASLNNLASTLQKAGRSEEALARFREILEIRTRLFGEDHASTLTTLSNMGACLIALHRLDEAAPVVRQALDGYLRVAGESHIKTLVTMSNLAFLEEDRGNLDEAEALYRRLIDIRARASNPDAPELLGAMNNLAMLLQKRGDLPAAEAVYADLAARAEHTMPRSHILRAIVDNNHGECLTLLGRLEEAEPLLRSSLATLESLLGPDHERVARARARLEALEARLDAAPPPASDPALTPP